MRHSVNGSSAASHRVIPEKSDGQLRVTLRKPENDELMAKVGQCLDYARRIAGWTVDRLAAELPPPPGSDTRDPRQVARWLDGKERTQVDVILAVPQLHGPFVIALARLDNKGVIEVETTIRIRESA
jgi:hypothetical protein